MPLVLAPTPVAATLSRSASLPVSMQSAYNPLLHGERRRVARRPGREQGMALEMLGHAVEYLIDSRMFLTQSPYTQAEEEAVRSLMAASRQVFEECTPIVPLRVRAAVWLQRAFWRRSLAA